MSDRTFLRCRALLVDSPLFKRAAIFLSFLETLVENAELFVVPRLKPVARRKAQHRCKDAHVAGLGTQNQKSVAPLE